MHTHQRRFAVVNPPFYKRDMRDVVHFVLERHRFKLAEHRRQACTRGPLHEGFALHTIFDQRFDRDHFQLVPPGKLGQFRHTSHRAVFVHDLADDAGRVESGQSCQVNRPFRLPCAPKHPADL